MEVIRGCEFSCREGWVAFRKSGTGRRSERSFDPGIPHHNPVWLNDHLSEAMRRMVADAGATFTVMLSEWRCLTLFHCPDQIPCGVTAAPPSMTSCLAAMS